MESTAENLGFGVNNNNPNVCSRLQLVLEQNKSKHLRESFFTRSNLEHGHITVSSVISMYSGG